MRYFTHALESVIDQLDRFMHDPEAGKLGAPPGEFVARVFLPEPNFIKAGCSARRWIIVSTHSPNKEFAAWETFYKAVQIMFAGKTVEDTLTSLYNELSRLESEYQKVVEEIKNGKDDTKATPENCDDRGGV